MQSRRERSREMEMKNDSMSRTNKTHVLNQICKHKRNHPNHDELPRWFDRLLYDLWPLLYGKEKKLIFKCCLYVSNDGPHHLRTLCSVFMYSTSQDYDACKNISNQLCSLSLFLCCQFQAVQICIFIWHIDWMKHKRHDEWFTYRK